MMGFYFIKQLGFSSIETVCIIRTIVNIQMDILYACYDTEDEFKLDLIEILEEDYHFTVEDSLKKICETIINRDLMEMIEEE